MDQGAYSPNILLIEASRMSQLIVKFFFIGLGCRLHMASNGWEALKKIDEDLFDIILIATKLPDIDGFTIASMVRQNSQYSSKTPIIALSNKADNAEREKATKAGMDDYFIMPLSESTCQNILEKYAPGTSTSGGFATT